MLSCSPLQLIRYFPHFAALDTSLLDDCRAIHGGGLYDLCQDGVDVSFTNFTWPMGTKYDRGVNISFTKEVILQPGDSLSGAGGASSVMISFKDATHAFRMDVSDTGIDGSTSCPQVMLPPCDESAAADLCAWYL